MRPSMSRGAPRTSLLRAGWVGDTHPLGSPCPVPRLDDAGQAVRQPEPLLDERHEVMTISLPADNQREMLHQAPHRRGRGRAGCGSPPPPRHAAPHWWRPHPRDRRSTRRASRGGGGRPGFGGQGRQFPDLHLGLEGQTGPGTDRSPSGTVRRGARSLCWLRVRGERRAFWH